MNTDEKRQVANDAAAVIKGSGHMAKRAVREARINCALWGQQGEVGPIAAFGIPMLVVRALQTGAQLAIASERGIEEADLLLTDEERSDENVRWAKRIKDELGLEKISLVEKGGTSLAGVMVDPGEEAGQGPIPLEHGEEPSPENPSEWIAGMAEGFRPFFEAVERGKATMEELPSDPREIVLALIRELLTHTNKGRGIRCTGLSGALFAAATWINGEAPDS